MLEDIKEECHINAALVLRQRVLFEVHVPVAIKERVNGRDATAFALFEKTKVTRGAGSGSDIKHAPLEFEDFAPFVHKDAVEVFPPQYLFGIRECIHGLLFAFTTSYATAQQLSSL